MAARTIPVVATRANNDKITGSGWNAGPPASTAFLTSRPQFYSIAAANTVSMPNNTLTAVTLANPALLPVPNAIDSDGGWNASQPTRYTCQVPGWYLVSGSVGYSANSSGQRMAIIRKNGADVWGGSSRMNVGVPNTSLPAPAVLLQMVAGDYVEIYGLQNSGATLSNPDAYSACTLSAVWVSA